MAERRASMFRQRDLTRAIKAAREAGETGSVRIEVDRDGKMIIITSREPEKAEGGKNEWDEELG